MLQPTKDLLLRPKGSMTRQELQQVQARRNAVLGQEPDDPNWGIKPNNLMTEADIDASKDNNGEVVMLADQKPQRDITIPQREHQTANGGVMPTRNASGDVVQPDNTQIPTQQAGEPKPRVPGTEVPKHNKFAIRKGSRDLADKVSNINDIAMRLANQAYPQQTAEDIETQQRREKRNALLAKIGDGLSSFHEAYAKMRGVQPMTNGTSLTGRMRERRERMDRERQEIDAKRQALAINWAKLIQQQRTAEDMADYRQAMAEYYAQQPKKWANEFQVKQQEAQNKKEHMERQDAETTRNNQAKEATDEKKRQDRKAAVAATNQTKKEIAANKEAGVQRRFDQREANKQAKTNNTGKTLPRNNNTGTTGRKLPRKK